MLLRHAEIAGRRGAGRASAGRVGADLRVEGGLVTEVAPVLRRRAGEPVYDCQGGAVLPGLCDHHVHLHAMAAWAGSVRCGPPEVTGVGAALLGHGITAVTDATPDLDEQAISAIEQAMTRGILPPRVIPELARLGVRVVTQPGFLAHRGDDFLRDVPPADRSDLYRCATLLRARIPVALSSDAPFGSLDPWAVIAAATGRRTASGDVAGPGERITFARALDAYLAPPGDPGGPPRRVGPGQPADLVVLRAPLAQADRLPDPVRAVLVKGTIAVEKELSG